MLSKKSLFFIHILNKLVACYKSYQAESNCYMQSTNYYYFDYVEIPFSTPRLSSFASLNLFFWSIKYL